MTATASVFDKAQALQREASRLRDGEAAATQVRRVSNRVTETATKLNVLHQAVTAARRLMSLDPLATVDLTGVDEGRSTFVRYAAAGPPSDQAFTAAQQKISAATARIGSSLSEAWARWAAAQLERLPLAGIAILSADHQRDARARSEELGKLSKKTPPASSDIDAFRVSYELLHETLQDVDDLPEEVATLLARLSKRPPLTLRDLTDEQISQLRQRDIAGQIQLQWRGM